MQKHYLVGLGACLAAATLPAQTADAVFDTRVHDLSSGYLANHGPRAATLFRGVVRYDRGAWLRLHLDGTNLPPGSELRLVATTDGAVQRFDARSLADYRHRSAYFNGNEVVIELIADGNTRANRLHVPRVDVGVGTSRLGPTTAASLCGADDRVLSSDPRQGRQYPTGCTSWLISESVVLTAGHCTSNPNQQIHFNVPLSSSSGSLRFPAPEDQYPYDSSSVQRLDAGVGADWAVANTVRNSNTGLYAGEAQGSWYALGSVPGSTSGQVIRITGYGTTSSPVPPEWNQVQKTHADALTQIASTYLRYITDTTGGNSGSPVVQEGTGNAIGIHTHAGCTSGGNHGTRIDRSDLQAAIQAALGGGSSAPSAPSNLTATAGSGQVALDWDDNSNNEDGFQLEKSTDGSVFAPLVSLPPNSTSYIDTGLASSTTFWYRVRAANAIGASAWSNIATATTPGPAVDYVATSDESVTGTAAGGLTATHTANGVSQSVTEINAGRGRKQASQLEHRWVIGGVPTSGSKTLFVLARQSASADGDQFSFEYGTANKRGKVSWTTALTISNTAFGNPVSVALPNTLSGDVLLRVVDTNRSNGATSLDTVSVDHLFVRVQ